MMRAAVRSTTVARTVTDGSSVEPMTLPGQPALSVRTQAMVSLRRQPLVAIALSWAMVLVTGALVEASAAAVVTLQAITWVQLSRSRRAAGVPITSALTAAVRSVMIPVVAIAVVLHLAHAARVTVDHVLLLGVVAAAAGGVAAAVRALRSRPPRVLVVGDLPQVRGLVARWIDESSVHVVGGLALGAPADIAEAGLADLGITSVGAMDDVVDYVAQHPTDLVVVASGPAINGDDVRRLSWALEHSDTRLALVGATEHVAPHRLDVDVIAGSTMALVARPGSSWVATLVKDAADRLLATVIALAVLPLVAAAAVAIRLDSSGSAFFTQTRVGRNGRLFTVYKLRTMRNDAEQVKAELADLDEGNGVLFKIHDDPRITRVGKLLRRTSIDELPQVLNVIKGDMSLVGPRPALPEEVALYTELEKRRLVVKPGITGLWQVSGRSSLSRDRSMQLDASYADNWRPQGDAMILLRTVDAVVTRRGAY